MLVLVINSGSSSIKYQVFDMTDESPLCSGSCEDIGVGGQIVHKNKEGQKTVIEQPFATHSDALGALVGVLANGPDAVIADVDDITAVGHRFSTEFGKLGGSAVIDDRVMAVLNETYVISPLHTPTMIAAVLACQQVFPHAKQVACFDATFNMTIPDYAHTYAIPWEVSQKYGFRRYGYHGNSHQFVTERVSQLIGRPATAVSCHLGSGSSVCAVKDGRAVDNSMGYTPLAGLMMGTRAGDVDPSIIFILCSKYGYTIEQVEDMFNKESGFLGVSGVSNDMREVMEAQAAGNDRARLANEMFYYQVKKYISAFTGILNGPDALIFTGGIGENDAEVRRILCDGLDYIGVKLDPAKNEQGSRKESLISAPDSKIAVWVIPTNEELIMARETYRFVK